MGLSIVGLVALLLAAAGRPWYVVGLSIYGGSLVVLYLASALLHTVHCSPAVEDRLERFDFVAIFLLIAGTYTPLCLVTLRGPWGWSVLGAEWGMAAIGITATLLGQRWPRWLRTSLYALMAWAVALVAIGPLYHAVSSAGIEWLLAGGVIYSVGAVIFATNRPHLWPNRFMAHDLWHCLVLAGSACHFVLIFRFVAMA
jgi:hemolysin III